jgi:hypothetical protein
MKPDKSEAEALIAEARASLPEHEPLVGVLDALSAAVRCFQSGGFTKEQISDVTRATTDAAENGVIRAAHRIEGLRLAIIAGACVASAVVGAAVTGFVVDRSADARMEAARIDVPAVFGALSAATAADWARLIALNAPPKTFLAAGEAITASDGSKASKVLLRTGPIPLTEQRK